MISKSGRRVGFCRPMQTVIVYFYSVTLLNIGIQYTVLISGGHHLNASGVPLVQVKSFFKTNTGTVYKRNVFRSLLLVEEAVSYSIWNAVINDNTPFHLK